MENNRKNSPRFCKNCTRKIPKNKNRRNAVYCSATCRREVISTEYRKAYPLTEIVSKSTIGTILELIVATDLLSKGYAVFRAISPTCSCDLILLKDGKPLRVEVTQGYRRKNGSVGLNKHDPSNYDIIAGVIGTEIHYFSAEFQNVVTHSFDLVEINT